MLLVLLKALQAPRLTEDKEMNVQVIYDGWYRFPFPLRVLVLEGFYIYYDEDEIKC